MSDKDKENLKLLREPFPVHLINKLPKGTKKQNQCPNDEKRNCTICGGWHHPKVIHLDYVGHAALTDRLLDVDPLWTWEPFATTENNLPAFDESGGLWIRLTICGQTRIGYGHAEESSFKEIGSREKEVIGDAIRNAAMRFGAALDLWHKGDLHPDETEDDKPPQKTLQDYEKEVTDMKTPKALESWWKKNEKEILATLSKDKADALIKHCGEKKKSMTKKDGEITIYHKEMKDFKEEFGEEAYRATLKEHGMKNAASAQTEEDRVRIVNAFIALRAVNAEKAKGEEAATEEEYVECPDNGDQMKVSYCENTCQSREGCPAFE